MADDQKPSNHPQQNYRMQSILCISTSYHYITCGFAMHIFAIFYSPERRPINTFTYLNILVSILTIGISDTSQ